MGLLRPYEQRKAKDAGQSDQAKVTIEDEAAAQPQPAQPGQTPKKGRPTPTRAEAEAARMARLHPQMTKKEQRAAAAAARRAGREATWDAQQKTPEKQLMRDFVDTRWTITEFLLPVMLVLVAISFFFSRNVPVQTGIMFVMVGLLIGWIANVFFMWRAYKKLAHERIKNPNFRGVLMEMNSRMMTIRRFRNPGPRINRGEEV
ncbi:DUF3043 domain-containing protein [Propionibacteriaceae bacterium G1746]|uniref:DUF3043 domain-containing protein n=1 Tax=Aestuariimicrobium sp. G57 TaxID=3418485 RepID=UPI003C1CC315